MKHLNLQIVILLFCLVNFTISQQRRPPQPQKPAQPVKRPPPGPKDANAQNGPKGPHQLANSPGSPPKKPGSHPKPGNQPQVGHFGSNNIQKPPAQLKNNNQRAPSNSPGKNNNPKSPPGHKPPPNLSGPKNNQNSGGSSHGKGPHKNVQNPQDSGKGPMNQHHREAPNSKPGNSGNLGKPQQNNKENHGSKNEPPKRNKDSTHSYRPVEVEVQLDAVNTGSFHHHHKSIDNKAHNGPSVSSGKKIEEKSSVVPENNRRPNEGLHEKHSHRTPPRPTHPPKKVKTDDRSKLDKQPKRPIIPTPDPIELPPKVNIPKIPKVWRKKDDDKPKEQIQPNKPEPKIHEKSSKIHDSRPTKTLETPLPKSPNVNIKPNINVPVRKKPEDDMQNSNHETPIKITKPPPRNQINSKTEPVITKEDKPKKDFIKNLEHFPTRPPKVNTPKHEENKPNVELTTKKPKPIIPQNINEAKQKVNIMTQRPIFKPHTLPPTSPPKFYVPKLWRKKDEDKPNEPKKPEALPTTHVRDEPVRQRDEDKPQVEVFKPTRPAMPSETFLTFPPTAKPVWKRPEPPSRNKNTPKNIELELPPDFPPLPPKFNIPKVKKVWRKFNEPKTKKPEVRITDPPETEPPVVYEIEEAQVEPEVTEAELVQSPELEEQEELPPEAEPLVQSEDDYNLPPQKYIKPTVPKFNQPDPSRQFNVPPKYPYPERQNPSFYTPNDDVVVDGELLPVNNSPVLYNHQPPQPFREEPESPPLIDEPKVMEDEVNEVNEVNEDPLLGNAIEDFEQGFSQDNEPFEHEESEEEEPSESESESENLENSEEIDQNENKLVELNLNKFDQDYYNELQDYVGESRDFGKPKFSSKKEPKKWWSMSSNSCQIRTNIIVTLIVLIITNDYILQYILHLQFP